MKKHFAVATAVTIIVLAGIAHAYYIGTFGGIDDTDTLKQFADRLQNVPLIIGDWVGTEQQEIDARERQVAGANAVLSRKYENSITGESVSIFLASGPFRNIAQHRPDQCYQAAGYSILMQPHLYQVPLPNDQKVDSYTTIFRREDHSATHTLRVFWTWSYDGVWQAPKSPRWTFARRPALYKLYFMTDIPAVGRQSIEQNPSVKFMEQFIPVLNEALFPKMAGHKESESSEPTGNDTPAAAPVLEDASVPDESKQ